MTKLFEFDSVWRYLHPMMFAVVGVSFLLSAFVEYSEGAILLPIIYGTVGVLSLIQSGYKLKEQSIIEL